MAEKKETTNSLVKIVLPLTEEKQDDVFVGINGMNYKIQRGIEVEVPASVAEVLKNSEEMDKLALIRRSKMANKQA